MGFLSNSGGDSGPAGGPPWMDNTRVMSVEEIRQRQRDFAAGRRPEVRQRSLQVTAASKKAGLTLDELRGFVDDAAELELGADAKVTAVMGFRGQIQSIQIAAND